MALLLANVALSDTFDTWRIRTNQIIADAASTSNTTTFTANVGFSGFVTTSLVPSANVTYDLGTSGNAWRDLYLSGNTIYLGNATISTGDGRVAISVDGAEVFNAQTGGAGSFDGEVTAPTVTANSFVGGTFTSDGLISAATITANTVTGTLSTAAQPNITSVGSLTTLSVGQITGTSGAGFAGLVTAPTVNANTVGGTLSTAAQPNITSVGTLSSLSVGGVTSTGLVSAAALTSNTLTAAGLVYPTTDGSDGQAIVTNGSGTLSFADAGISTGKAIAMAIVFG